MVSCTWILIGFTDYLAAAFKNGLFVDNLRNFLEYEEKIPEDYKGDDPGTEIHSIEFRNVCFSYKLRAAHEAALPEERQHLKVIPLAKAR